VLLGGTHHVLSGALIYVVMCLPLIAYLAQMRTKYGDRWRAVPSATVAKPYWDRVAQLRWAHGARTLTDSSCDGQGSLQ
jgi:hypothetical protein